jgi:hypothetical protein
MRKRQRRNTDDKARSTEAERKRESGMPGGGQGRKDKIERSGVYAQIGKIRMRATFTKI